MYKLFIGLVLPPDPSSKSREAQLPDARLEVETWFARATNGY